MNNIICLKHGTKFDADYVNKLYYGVKRNTTVDFTFHCFTEDSEGLNINIKVHSLPKFDNVEGWWYKLYLFSEDIDIEGRILYIDLDTLITGNIDHYITQNEGFVVLQDLWAKGDNVGSALMSYEVGKHKHVWDIFIKDPAAAKQKIFPHGDQKIIQAHQSKRIYWQILFPNEIISFKSNNAKEPTKDVKIICFHGIPSIKNAINTTTKVQRFILTPAKWIEKYWKLDE